MDFLQFKEAVESIRRVRQSDGVAYWLARDLQNLLGYDKWQSFKSAIERAINACESAGRNAHHHFTDLSKVIKGGKGADVQKQDYYLTRFACYLIAINGDTRKKEIGLAQTYFTVKTRQQEIREEMSEDQRRIDKRLQTKKHNTILRDVAHDAGVKQFGLFYNSGYKGLYDMNYKDIKEKKGVPEKEDLLDYAGFEELAANDFRITQTARVLKQEGVSSEADASQTHYDVGRAVRKTIEGLGNPTPEKLPIEKDIKPLLREREKKQLPPKK